MVVYGYEITKNNFMFLCENGYFIKMPELLKLNVDEQIADMYIKNGICPPNYEMTPIKKLELMFSTNEKIDDIKCFIKKCNIAPTIYCLQIVCAFRNIEHIKFIQENYAIEPDKICFDNIFKYEFHYDNECNYKDIISCAEIIDCLTKNMKICKKF